MTTGTLNLGNLFSMPICCCSRSLKDAHIPRLFLDLLCLAGLWAEPLALFRPSPSPLPVTHGDVGTPRFSPYCSLFYLRRLSALLSVLVFVHPSPRFCVSSSNHSPWVMSFTSVTSATIPLRDTPNSVFSHDLMHELLTSLSDFLQVVCSQGPLNFFS